MSDSTPQSAAPVAAESTPSDISTSAAEDTSSQQDTPSQDDEPSLDARIADALENEGLDGDEDAPVEREAAPEEEEAAPAAPKPIIAKDEFDEILEAEGHGKKKDALGRENRIPYSATKKIIENARKKWEAEVVPTAITQRDAEWQEFTAPIQEKFEKVSRTEQLMAEEPETFLYALSEAHPAYKQLLAPILGGQRDASNSAPNLRTQGAPEPDLDLGNGQFTYSQQGFQQRLAWERQQAVQEAEARVMKQFEPILKREQEEAILTHAHQTVTTQAAEARQWPGFAENEQEIIQVLRDNPRADLNSAYRHVVYGKMQQRVNMTEAEMRKKILDDMKRQPKSTSVSPNAPISRPVDDKEDLDANIAAALKAQGL